MLITFPIVVCRVFCDFLKKQSNNTNLGRYIRTKHFQVNVLNIQEADTCNRF